jgi:hypothetical protein
MVAIRPTKVDDIVPSPSLERLAKNPVALDLGFRL